LWSILISSHYPTGPTVDWPIPRAYAQAMGTRDLITQKLTAAFAPASLEVRDDSHLHQGHAGHRPGGDTHFAVHIVANAFKGKTRVERHRMINEALLDELRGGVHALAIQALAPGEHAR
jgi:BolA family transcriptional regulator, general stress-responsive regulator